MIKVIGFLLFTLGILYLSFLIKMTKDLNLINRFKDLKGDIGKFIIFSTVFLFIIIYISILFIQ